MSKSRGQTLVEFAICMPIFVLLIFSLIEGGRFMFTWVLLSEATREGIRAAVLPSTTSTTTIVNQANGLAKYAPGFSTSGVSVYKNGTPVPTDPGTFTKNRGDTMKVQITYTFQFLTGSGLLPFANNYPITTATQMWAEG